MIFSFSKKKQVCTNNDAAFLCNFLFNIFFYSLISLDFAIDFAIFPMWLQACGWTNGQTDGQINGQTDGMMGGETNKWMDMQHTCKK